MIQLVRSNGYAVVAVLLLSSLASCGFKEKEFNISGEIKNLPAGTKIFLQEWERDKVINLDTTRVDANGVFHLKVVLKHEDIYQIRYGGDKYIALLMGSKPGNIVVHADTTSFLVKPYTFEGSPLSTQLQNFQLEFNRRYQPLQETFLHLRDTLAHPLSDSLKRVYNAQMELQTLDTRNYVATYVDTVTDPVIGIFACYYFLDPQNDLPVFTKLADKIAKNNPDLPLGEMFRNDVAIEKQKQSNEYHPIFANGTQLPDIEMKDIKGNKLKLSSLRGKYVLVDFWASWCNPCRAENPHVVQAYNTYKDKGFTVYSVSLDEDKAKWLKAIDQDKLSWSNHVSELKGWHSEVCESFGITQIPTNYLIDKDGKVIASDLKGKELENLLEQQLK